MTATPVDKVWRVPASAGRGPVRIAVRLPEVRITDGEDREIVLAPEQLDLVSARLSAISDWMHSGTDE